ncbi:YqjF family protein [Ohtaekwangia sp.]|uniref:YqjF family protein n=1 Tax=Ohtaekwangia sp. TaxID=2066019 RepID=UPI002F94213A
MAAVFLTAEWRKLAMANYVVDPSALQPYLPNKTELDLWNDTCYVSLVGFMFLNTKLCGLRIPFHHTFEEVNLRFYVKYKDITGWKRGVVFIKEIVPKPALTFVANTMYGEHYQTLPMSHMIEAKDDRLTVAYRWELQRWHSLEVTAAKNTVAIREGSEEEFITEHYWGYTQLAPHRTSEYAVEHPRWMVFPVSSYRIDVDFGKIYGGGFSNLSTQKPGSVFLAEGSEIVVRRGTKI